MRVKLYVNKNDLEAFNDLYENINKGKVLDLKDVPILDVKEHVKSQSRHKFVEVLLLYEIYKGMQYLFIDKVEELKKVKGKK